MAVVMLEQNKIEKQVNQVFFKLTYLYYYTLYSLPVFSLAKSLQLILEISDTYRLVSYLLADNWLIWLKLWKVWTQESFQK